MTHVVKDPGAGLSQHERCDRHSHLHTHPHSVKPSGLDLARFVQYPLLILLFHSFFFFFSEKRGLLPGHGKTLVFATAKQLY